MSARAVEKILIQNWFGGIVDRRALCPRCGKRLIENAPVCPLCGQELLWKTETSNWIPVTERLPIMGRVVLWCNDVGGTFTSAITWTDGHRWAIGKKHRRRVVAWMPLPEPYKEADAKDRISKLPSAQTKQKTGRWIHHTDWERDGETPYECDQCGRCFDYKMRFCGFCGAQMEREK